MTVDEIAAWETKQLSDHDLTDLADAVQLLRTLGWSACLQEWLSIPSQMAFVWFESLEAFQPTVELLKLRAIEATSPEYRAMAEALARLYSAVHQALVAGPKRPTDDELVWRYVIGEIGDRTVQHIAGWDSFRLTAECHYRGLPPLQTERD
jgi:hypothetical protein